MPEKSLPESSKPILPLSLNEARKRLFAHRSLVDLWRASWLLGGDWAQIALAMGVAFIIFVGALALPLQPSDAIGFARSVANDGLTFATTLLGFLIAGFTVFATITKPEIFALMARWPEDNGLTHLQKVFLLFMQVFAHYCAFCLLCVMVKLIAGPKGIATLVFGSVNPELKLILGSIAWSILSAWFFYLLLLLPIFIYNMYSMQLVVIDVAMLEQEEESRTP